MARWPQVGVPAGRGHLRAGRAHGARPGGGHGAADERRGLVEKGLEGMGF